MKPFSISIVVLLLPLVAKGNVGHVPEKVVLCTMQENGAIRRPDRDAFTPEDLDATICTHLIYNGVRIDSDNYHLVPRYPKIDFYDKGGLGLYNRTMKLKELNPKLKIILEVCCLRHFFWDSSKAAFRFPTTINSTIMSEFSENAVNYLQLYGFDGMHIRWHVHENMSQLMSRLRLELDKYGLILTTFFMPSTTEEQDELQIPTAMAEPVDLVLIGSYWKETLNRTTFFSPLTELRKYISAYLDQGFPPQKLVVSIPTVTMTMKLCNRNDSGLSAEICTARNEEMEDPNEEILTYIELVQKLKNTSEGWVVERDSATSMPYAHSDSLIWVGYEDSVSVRAKAQYVLQKNLAGISIMNVDTDDFVGYNDEGIKFPLTRAAYDTLNGN